MLTVMGSPPLHRVAVSILILCRLLICVVTLLMCHCLDLACSSLVITALVPCPVNWLLSQVPPTPQPSMEVPRLYLLLCLYLLAQLRVLDSWSTNLPKTYFSFTFLLFMKVNCPLRNLHLRNCHVIYLINIFKCVL